MTEDLRVPVLLSSSDLWSLVEVLSYGITQGMLVEDESLEWGNHMIGRLNTLRDALIILEECIAGNAKS